MYDAKVSFSLFASLNVRTQILDMESNGQIYGPVYVSRGVFDGDLKKIDTELKGNKFRLSLKCPKFICECSCDFLKLVHKKSITYFYVVKFFYTFFTKLEHMLRFLSINFMSRLLSSD